jgi:hypothetical protein
MVKIVVLPTVESLISGRQARGESARQRKLMRLRRDLRTTFRLEFKHIHRDECVHSRKKSLRYKATCHGIFSGSEPEKQWFDQACFTSNDCATCDLTYV